MRSNQDYGSLKTEREAQNDQGKAGDLVYSYLRSINRYPLLKPEAEREISCFIWESRKVFAFCEQYGIEPPENLEELFQEAREIMIILNLQLVFKIASPYQDFHLTFLDFVQQGNLGLMKAVDRFDYRRKTKFGTYAKFSTYARYWIIESILYAFAYQSKYIHIAGHAEEMIIKIRKFISRFARANSRLPSPEEIAKNLSISIEDVQNCLEIDSWQFQSLHTAKYPDSDRLLSDTLTDDKMPTPEENAYATHRRETIDDVLSDLPDRQEYVLKRRFGMEGPAAILEQIGDELKRTKEGIRQLEKRALTRLRHPSRAERLKPFFQEL